MIAWQSVVWSVSKSDQLSDILGYQALILRFCGGDMEVLLMSHRAVSSIIGLKWIALIIVLTALSTTLVISTFSVKDVQAQEATSNMRTVLMHLNDEKVTVLFQFATPLVANQTDWIIPDLGETDPNVSHVISEIGDNHICFWERAGEAISIRCTPYSNIVSISYLNMPK